MHLAPINKIIECSTVDGPGLRTSVFVQKCNIHCLYCHNPETQNLCRSCGKCIKTCPVSALSMKEGKVEWDSKICVFCDTCIQVCPFHASPKVKYRSAEDVYQEIRKNLGFIRGITVSGGECSLYPEFLFDLFTLAKKDGLTCLMDSNGMVDYSLFPELMAMTDGVMLDIKSWDEDIYKRLVGYSNSQVKKNLAYLDSIHKIEELRIVVVDDYVDSCSCIDGIASTIKKENIKDTKLKLIRFRKNGVKGILSDHPSPKEETMQDLKKHAEERGFEKIEIR